MLKVKSVVANNDFTLFVELTDGRSGMFDMKPYLDKGVFTQLQDIAYFKQVKPLFCGITWPNEQDLSADTLAHELKPVEPLN
jgi:hypothetical protein